eukprot:TRINITY_DN40463_c0_g1_i1.p1 TRINITY_DN40463_c0_g1~~TRINITY_DN40463_c0_g1_i1.p1  ORF type:complete len:753 (-),score=188.97 TRINITY_DN40463_c0_g1_i1:333-2591(-)
MSLSSVRIAAGCGGGGPSTSSADDALPVGEGWSKHSADMLVHAPSQVFFAKCGEHRGKYLLQSDGGWSVCPAPHVGSDCSVDVKAAAACVLRQSEPSSNTGQAGGKSADADKKMERSVVLADMPKTARLALKFPLGFLDNPAAMYAVFSGLRGSVATAHWCASQFHQRLLKEIAKKIHGWWDSEAEMPEELLYRGSHVGSLSKVLKDVLETLDKDLVNGPHGLGGCDAVVGVLVGENLVTAAVGQASTTLLFDDADAVPLVPLLGQTEEDDESEAVNSATANAVSRLLPGHVSEQGALLGRDKLLRRARAAWDVRSEAEEGQQEAVNRILEAPDAFTVLGISPSGPDGPAEARSAYKRLALKVHPDKVRDVDPGDAKAAFARLEAASRIIEDMMAANGESCRELHRVLRLDPFTVRGAAAVLEVETDVAEKQVNSALTTKKEKIAKAQTMDALSEVQRGVDACSQAAETLRVAREAGAPGTAAEKLMLEGVPSESLTALGLRDLRGIGGRLEVRTASYRAGEEVRVALCCGATAELPLSELEGPAKFFTWQPKAAALQWATKALALPARQRDTSASAICICLRERDEDEAGNAVEDPISGRPVKKQKGPAGPRSVRLRHLLLRCAETGKKLPDDPLARRLKGNAADLAKTRTPAMAESELVKLLHELITMEPAPGCRDDIEVQRSTAFRKHCQQRSECSTADNAGQLCGDLGWVSRGQGEIAFEQAAFTLRKGDFSDVVTTSRGIHIIQRIA